MPISKHTNDAASLLELSPPINTGIALVQFQCFSQDSLLQLLDRAMGFIMEFAENLILRLMEDPDERDNKWREKMYNRFEKCKKTREMWSYPLKPYGFWTFDRFNAQIFWDAQISQVAGRRDPYDDLIEEHSKPSSSK